MFKGQSEGQAGPMSCRWRIEDGAASQASTNGVERVSDQLRENAHGGDETVR